MGDPQYSRINWRLALTGLVMVAMLVRLGFALALPRVIKWDESAYLLLGRNLLTGQGYNYYTGHPEVVHPPLYPFVSGTLYLIVGDLEWASNVAHVLFGGLLLLPTFLIARHIYDSQSAWLAATLLAIFPPLTISVLFWGAMVEPLYLCLIYGGLAALLLGLENNRVRLLAVSGGLFGLAYLTRPEALACFGVFLIFTFVWLIRGPDSRTLRAWYSLGAFVLLFAFFAAPYVWYLHAQTGHWMTSGKLNLAWTAFDPMIAHDPVAFDRLNTGLDASGQELYWFSPDRFQGSPLRTILANPRVLAQRVMANERELHRLFFERGVFWYGLLPLVGLALFKRPWDRRRLRHEAFLLTTTSVLTLVFLPFGFLVRYLAPVFPVLLIWSARGSLELGIWLHDTLNLLRARPVWSKHTTRILKWLPACMVVLFLLVMTRQVAGGAKAGTFFGHKQAGLWLRLHTPSDAAIMTAEAGTALYADRRYVPSPHADWTRFLAYARAHHANYLVVHEWELEARPHLAFLFDTGDPALELVFKFEEVDTHYRTFVYRFLQH